MNLKFYNPYTPSMRFRSVLNFKNISKKKPEKNLISFINRSYGRNNQGKITSKHKQSGHKKLYRKIDFKRNKFNILGTVIAIEYDPNRNVSIALINYTDNEKRYILCPEGLKINDIIMSSKENNIELNIGNTLKLMYIPVGIFINNIEIYPNKGGQIIRSAGTYGKIIFKKKKFVLIKLASKKLHLFNENCLATIGRLNNLEFYNINKGKAGKNRWLGNRPKVRGSAMNAVDHPHGGGEGKSPIGRPSPLTPWGKPTLGYKTSNKINKKKLFSIIN
jgi:large subunit ribosomal protein L2